MRRPGRVLCKEEDTHEMLQSLRSLSMTVIIEIHFAWQAVAALEIWHKVRLMLLPIPGLAPGWVMHN